MEKDKTETYTIKKIDTKKEFKEFTHILLFFGTLGIKKEIKNNEK